MRPIAIDLFAGAGGLSLGFEQAGFDVAAAVEIDPVHCAVHKYNFPHTAVIPESVTELSATNLRRMSGIGNAEVDCVFGGAPCQGFSMIGKRILDDPRNNLVLEFVRIVSELKARSFVFENVKGLTLGKHKEFLMELVAAFNDVGYTVRLPWQVLNAANFGTPQSRERLILMGVRNGEKLPYYPTPTTNIPSCKNPLAGLPTCPSCKDALGDLPDADSFNALLHGDTVRTADFGRLSPYAAELRCTTNDSWHFGFVRVWDAFALTSSARTMHTDITRRRFSETEAGSVEPISRFYKLSAEGICNTLRAGTDAARGAFTSPRPIHYKYDRCITVREMARLHGFPDWFRFNVTKWHGARQIGNAVPPPLTRAVATQIMAILGHTASRPAQPITLGDPTLLSMDLSSASAYFGVIPPTNRRDRKSGVRKRKQLDIERERLSTETTHG